MAQVKNPNKITSGMPTSPSPLSRVRIVIVLFAYVLGFACSVILLAGSAGHPAFGRVCELMGADCVAVTTGAWASILGLSWASLGVAWFVSMLVLRLGALSGVLVLPERLVLFAHVAVLGVGLYLSLLMLSGISGVCPLCFLVHGMNALATFTLGLRTGAWTADVKSTSPLPSWVVVYCGVAAFVIAVCAANWWVTAADLNATRERIASNLNYWHFLHRQQTAHEFIPKPDDQAFDLEGDGFHQIVLIYKDGCAHCDRAKAFLSQLARKHRDAVYVIFKNYKSLSPVRLREIGVSGTPAVFLDGRLAEGWEVPGFFREVIGDDCDC